MGVQVDRISRLLKEADNLLISAQDEALLEPMLHERVCGVRRLMTDLIGDVDAWLKDLQEEADRQVYGHD